MALPKGFGSGGSGGAGRADVEAMIGRRVENMVGIITLSYLGAFFATVFGTMVGYLYYPWAYASASGHYAMIVLTVVEAIGYIFCVKVVEEGTNKRSNGCFSRYNHLYVVRSIVHLLEIKSPHFPLFIIFFNNFSTIHRFIHASRSAKFHKILYSHSSARSLMVWLRRCTHYLFIVVVAVNSTLLTINSGDYIFYTDWAWTSFVVFSIANTLMTVVGAVYYITFTGVPGTGAYYGLIMQVYTWVAKVAWFALGYPVDFIVHPMWIPSCMLLDLAYWATKKNKHSLIFFGGVLVGMSMPLFNMVQLMMIADPLETAFKYPRPTLPPYMTPIEPQVGKFYNSPVALGAGAGSVLSVTFAALGCKLNTWTYRWMAAWSKWD